MITGWPPPPPPPLSPSPSPTHLHHLHLLDLTILYLFPLLFLLHLLLLLTLHLPLLLLFRKGGGKEEQQLLLPILLFRSLKFPYATVLRSPSCPVNWERQIHTPLVWPLAYLFARLSSGIHSVTFASSRCFFQTKIFARRIHSLLSKLTHID